MMSGVEEEPRFTEKLKIRSKRRLGREETLEGAQRR